VSSSGIITTVAGVGVTGHDGDGGPAKAARLNGPGGVSRYPGGGFLISEAGANTIRRVKPDGTIFTIAGTGAPGARGDGGPAQKAELRNPRNVAALADGSYLIADAGNNRIRAVGADGIMRTVAGSGASGYEGDGGAAEAARLNSPTGVAPVAGGGFLIADRGNGVIRQVAPDGTISTVAGGGAPGGEGSATQVRLRLPTGVAALPGGGFLIADAGRVRRVGPDGRIVTLAGTGRVGFSGESGPATAVKLAYVAAVALIPADGAILLVDEANDRIRRVSLTGLLATKVGSGTPPPPQDQDSPPPAAKRSAGPAGVAVAASAGAMTVLSAASRAHCDRKYIAAFAQLFFVPLDRPRFVVRRSKQTLTVRYRTWVKGRSARAYVVAKILLGDKVVRRSAVERNTNGVHGVKLPLRLTAHLRYDLQLDGTGPHTKGDTGAHTRRCDALPLRMK
jgi:hypothetical protein